MYIQGMSPLQTGQVVYFTVLYATVYIFGIHQFLNHMYPNDVGARAHALNAEAVVVKK